MSKSYAVSVVRAHFTQILYTTLIIYQVTNRQ